MSVGCTVATAPAVGGIELAQRLDGEHRRGRSLVADDPDHSPLDHPPRPGSCSAGCVRATPTGRCRARLAVDVDVDLLGAGADVETVADRQQAAAGRPRLAVVQIEGRHVASSFSAGSDGDSTSYRSTGGLRPAATSRRRADRAAPIGCRRGSRVTRIGPFGHRHPHAERDQQRNETGRDCRPSDPSGCWRHDRRARSTTGRTTRRRRVRAPAFAVRPEHRPRSTRPSRRSSARCARHASAPASPGRSRSP